MKKRILLIGGNFAPEPTGIGKYNGDMIEWLSANGYECSVITTYPYYPQWRVHDKYRKTAYWYKKERMTAVGKKEPVTVFRCPHYVPKNPSGLKRVLSDASFFLTALLCLIPFLFRKKYDIVLTVVPPFHIGLLGILYKKVKGASFLYHIQDLQIEAAQQLGLISSAKAIKLLYNTERYILQMADLISTISDGMLKKVKAKTTNDVQLFPNWVDTSLFYPMPETDTTKAQYGYQSTDKIVLYSGAIGEKQGLESILYAAKALRQYPYIKFVICGSGPYKDKLVSLKNQLALENVAFLPLQPLEKLNLFLNMADIHLVLQKADAADLVMPSKLTSILAIGGLAIVTAAQGTSLADCMATHNMGIVIEPGDQDVLTATILKTLCSDHQPLRKNARFYAQNVIAIDGVFQSYLSALHKKMKWQQEEVIVANAVHFSNEAAT